MEQAENGIEWTGRIEDFEMFACFDSVSSNKLRTSLEEHGQAIVVDKKRNIFRVEIAGQHTIVGFSHYKFAPTVTGTKSRVWAQANASVVAAHGAAVSILGPDGEWLYVSAPVQEGRPLQPRVIRIAAA